MLEPTSTTNRHCFNRIREVRRAGLDAAQAAARDATGRDAYARAVLSLVLAVGALLGGGSPATYAQGIDPGTVSGQIFWLDAQDPGGFILAGADQVDRWRDLSPRGNDAVGIDGTDPIIGNQITRPQYVSTGLNGLPAVEFSAFGATNQVLISQANSGLAGTDFAMTAFVVGSQNSRSSFTAFLSQLGLGGRDYRNLGLVTSTSGAIATDSWAPEGKRTSTGDYWSADGVSMGGSGSWNSFSQHWVPLGSVPLDTPFVASIVIPRWEEQDVNARFQYGGTELLANKYGFTGPTDLKPGSFRVGNWATDRSDMNWRGLIGELIVYDRELSVGEISGITAHLQSSWGLTGSVAAELWSGTREAVFSGTAGVVTVPDSGVTVGSGLNFQADGYSIAYDATGDAFNNFVFSNQLSLSQSSTLAVADTATAKISTLVTGDQSVTKAGGGNLVLTNPFSMFSGALRVNEGTVTAGGNGVRNEGAFAAVYASHNGISSSLGAVNVARDIVIGPAATLNFIGDDTFGDLTAAVTPVRIQVNGGMVTNGPTVPDNGTPVPSAAHGAFNALGKLELNSGVLRSTAGRSASPGYPGFQAFELRGAVTSSGTSSIETVLGEGQTFAGIHLGQGASFDVGSGGSLAVSAVLLDAAHDAGPRQATGFTKSGAGTMILSGANTYSGPTIVREGVLRVGGGLDPLRNTAVTVTSPSTIDPATLSNMILRLNALDASSITTTDGSRVVRWDDLSPQQNDAIGSTGNDPVTGGRLGQPILVADAINGRPALRFSAGGATNEVLITQNNSGLAGSQFAMTAFMVVNQSSRSTFTAMLSQLAPGARENRSLGFVTGPGGAILTDSWQPSGSTTGAAAVPLATPTIVAISIPLWDTQRADSDFWVNGQPLSSSPYGLNFPTTSLNAGAFRIGNWDTERSDMNWRGDIGEVVVFDRSLSVEEIDGVNGFLAAAWGLETPRGWLQLPGSTALGGLTVESRGLVTLPESARAVVTTPTLAVDAASGGLIDLGGGVIEIAAGGISAADLRADIIAGRNGGAWNGTTGIMSSTAAASGGTRAVGYVVAGDGSARVSYAAAGDVDLSGAVNVFDLVSINSGGKYGTGQSAVWSQGDFNYDGVTNVFDLVGINTAAVYGQGNYFPAAPSALAVTAVPEPGSMLSLVAAAVVGGCLIRRRAPIVNPLASLQRLD